MVGIREGFGKGSSASDTRRWTPAVMSDIQNPLRIADNTKEKMIRKPMPVGAAKIGRADGKRFGPLRRLLHEVPQLAVEIFRKLKTGDPLLILHDRVDIGGDFRMKDKSHQRRRLPIC